MAFASVLYPGRCLASQPTGVHFPPGGGEGANSPRGTVACPPSTTSPPFPLLVPRHLSPFGLWEIEPPFAVLAFTAPAASPAAASPAAASPTAVSAAAAASAAAASAAAAAATARRFFLPVLLFLFAAASAASAASAAAGAVATRVPVAANAAAPAVASALATNSPREGQCPRSNVQIQFKRRSSQDPSDPLAGRHAAGCPSRS